MVTVEGWAVKAPDSTKVLELLKKRTEWGIEVDRNHLFTYYDFRVMIEEAEDRVRITEVEG